MKQEPTELHGFIKPNSVGIPRLQAGEEVNLIEGGKLLAGLSLNPFGQFLPTTAELIPVVERIVVESRYHIAVFVQTVPTVLSMGFERFFIVQCQSAFRFLEGFACSVVLVFALAFN